MLPIIIIMKRLVITLTPGTFLIYSRYLAISRFLGRFKSHEHNRGTFLFHLLPSLREICAAHFNCNYLHLLMMSKHFIVHYTGHSFSFSSSYAYHTFITINFIYLSVVVVDLFFVTNKLKIPYVFCILFNRTLLLASRNTKTYLRFFSTFTGN